MTHGAGLLVQQMTHGAGLKVQQMTHGAGLLVQQLTHGYILKAQQQTYGIGRMKQMRHLRCLFSEGHPSLEASLSKYSIKHRMISSPKPVKRFETGSLALEEPLKIGPPVQYMT